VLVGGLPGSGKSTLAAPLARELGLPLIWDPQHTQPLGVGPLVEVDTTRPVAIPELAERVRAAVSRAAGQ
jgi:predicted kinase